MPRTRCGSASRHRWPRPRSWTSYHRGRSRTLGRPPGTRRQRRAGRPRGRSQGSPGRRARQRPDRRRSSTPHAGCVRGPRASSRCDPPGERFEDARALAGGDQPCERVVRPELARAWVGGSQGAQDAFDRAIQEPLPFVEPLTALSARVSLTEGREVGPSDVKCVPRVSNDLPGDRVSKPQCPTLLTQESSALHAEGFEIRSADAPVDPRGLVGQVAAIAQVYDVLAGDAEDARGFAGGQEGVADGGGRFVVDDLTHGPSIWRLPQKHNAHACELRLLCLHGRKGAEGSAPRSGAARRTGRSAAARPGNGEPTSRPSPASTGTVPRPAGQPTRPRRSPGAPASAFHGAVVPET